MADWNMVAYNNFYNALKSGQPVSHVQSNAQTYEGGKYLPYFQNALNKWQSEQQSSASHAVSSAPTIAPAAQAPPTQKPAQPMAPKPSLNLPSLEMSEGASVVNQFNKLRAPDSMLKKQAVVDAYEKGVASGRIHSSQQAGAAERAIEDKLMPLATAEANLVASTDIANWQQKTNQYVLSYQNDYKDYLMDKGYSQERTIAMLGANTNLTMAYLDNIGRLLNNPEIDFGQEVNNKLVSIFNRGLENSNTILDLGFSYA